MNILSLIIVSTCIYIYISILVTRSMSFHILFSCHLSPFLLGISYRYYHLSLLSLSQWLVGINLITFPQRTLEHLLNNGGYTIISAGRNPAIWTDLNLTDRMIAKRTDSFIADIENIYLYTSVFMMMVLKRVFCLFYTTYHQRKNVKNFYD